jgi:ubiquinone/menaquinone biosynthesis C-methylase UbiE
MSVKTFYDSIAKTYDQRFQTPLAEIENTLATTNLPTKNVLDLGCGTGLYLEYCQPDGYIGLDISSGMFNVARQKFPNHRFICADMAEIPLPDESVDAVVSLFGSFSYCLTPHACVDEIQRVLRPGGRVVVMLLTQRYLNRKSHVAHGVLPVMTYTARQAKHLFAPFGDVNVRGLNVCLDALQTLPTPLMKAYARLEHATLSRWLPNLCYFLMVEVMKCPSEN